MIIHAQLLPTGNAPHSKTGALTEQGWCAICTRCNHDVSVAGQQREACKAALELLREECPKGEVNRYVKRVIPPGCRVVIHHAGMNKLYPVEVTGRTPHTLAGAVTPRTPLYVIPDSKTEWELACGFAATLANWGFNATVKPAGFTLEQSIAHGSENRS